MAKNKIQMPQSTAGLVRYFEDTKEAIKIKPEYIAAASIAIVALEIALRFIAV
jgi:preprotein translocase subunit Sec61beta